MIRAYEIENTANYDLPSVVKVIQRSNKDPVNRWDDNLQEWSRCIDVRDGRAIITVKKEENLCIYMELLKGNITKHQTIRYVSDLLGLDDKIFSQKDSYPFVNEARLKDVVFSPLPGYATMFEAIVQTILGQLVSTIVANQNRCRFVSMFGELVEHNGKKYYLFPTLEQTTTFADSREQAVDSIKTIGINRMKAIAIYEAAEAFSDEKWLECLTTASISDAIAQLTQIKGVGLWTAKWFLFRGLRRFDVAPTTDLVVRKALSWWFEKKSLQNATQLDEKLLEIDGIQEVQGLYAYRVLLSYTNSLALERSRQLPQKCSKTVRDDTGTTMLFKSTRKRRGLSIKEKKKQSSAISSENMLSTKRRKM